MVESVLVSRQPSFPVTPFPPAPRGTHSTNAMTAAVRDVVELHPAAERDNYLGAQVAAVSAELAMQTVHGNPSEALQVELDS